MASLASFYIRNEDGFERNYVRRNHRNKDLKELLVRANKLLTSSIANHNKNLIGRKITIDVNASISRKVHESWPNLGRQLGHEFAKLSCSTLRSFFSLCKGS